MIINKEFNLSEKIEENDDDVMEEFELKEDEKEWIYAKDVREFIRLLKESLRSQTFSDEPDDNLYLSVKKIKGRINKLAGDKFKGDRR